jgi:Uma2 family endonuclease
MATATAGKTQVLKCETLADLMDRLGNIPPERIRMKPAPGTATVRDVIKALEAPRRRICELIDGVLVEKPMGSKESTYGGFLREYLGVYFNSLPVYPGLLLMADGTLEIMPGLVRIPDLSFVSWERIGADEWPSEPVPGLVPDLAIEVLSRSNRRDEMERKLRDYFDAGVREVWLVYPETQVIDIYLAPDKKRRIPKDGTLTGSVVFPGFSLSVSKLFASTRRGKKR